MRKPCKKAEPDCCPDPKYKGAWRAEVASRIGELEGRLRAVEGGRRRREGAEPSKRRLRRCPQVSGAATETEPSKKEPWQWVAEAVESDLCRARKAIQPPGCFRSLRAWWSGSAITTAWESVHVAENALLAIEGGEEVEVIAPRLLGWIERTMDQGDQRKAHEEALKKPKPTRMEVRAALADVIEVNGNRYANLRAFRNTLILIMSALLLAVVGIAVWHALNPNFLSLCSSSEVKPGETMTRCLDGGSKSSTIDVAVVAALGALGGLLAIAFSFSERDPAPTRYDPKTWQAFLKPVTGAATALVAILLIQSDLLLKPVEQNQTVFLAYAVAFGFSQQLLTQFVDKRANSLITPAAK